MLLKIQCLVHRHGVDMQFKTCLSSLQTPAKAQKHSLNCTSKDFVEQLRTCILLWPWSSTGWSEPANTLLTLGAHAHSEGYSSCRVCMYVCVCVCVYVCVTTHNCRLTHWNHKTEIPTCSQQYSDRFKFCRFS